MKKIVSTFLLALIACLGVNVAAAQSVTTTFTVVNGPGYMMNMWNVTTGSQIEIYSNNPTEVTFNAGDKIFIGTVTNVDLYCLEVDGKTVPTSLCDVQSDFYNYYGYMLTPDCGYYPTAGGSVNIYQEAASTTECTLSFNFANPGTEGFISQMRVGYGAMMDAEEIAEVLARGSMSIAAGTNLEIYFNMADYNVNSATVNGTSLGLNNSTRTYNNGSVDTDLAFNFDVTQTGTNTVTFLAKGFQGIVVHDRNGVDIPLTGETTIAHLPRSMSEITVMAATGYEIAEDGVTVQYPDAVKAEVYNGADYFDVVDGMVVTVRLKDEEEENPGQVTYIFNCSADVLTFTGMPANPTVTYTDGRYTVTDIPETSLQASVKEQYQSTYVIASVTFGTQTLSSDGVRFNVPVTQINGNAEFTVNFKEDTTPRYVTIVPSTAAWLSRAYNDNVMMTSFPAQFDVTNGSTLTLEAANFKQINSILLDGVKMNVNLPASTVTVDLADAVDGSTLYIDITDIPGDYIYTFEGPEGLSIVYNGLEATYAQGLYTVSNVYQSTADWYSVQISVKSEYSNQVYLVNVSDGKNIWEPAGSSNIIYISGSQLPKTDAFFTVTTRGPKPSETTRTVYLTIDNPDVVAYGRYQGMSGYFGFDAQGVATLTISPSEYTIEIATTKAIVAIVTDVEDTFRMPDLPSTSFALDLTNALEGQTISLYTDDKNSGVEAIDADGIGAQEIYNLHGVRVAPERLVPGIYIVGGRKTVIR